MLQVGPPDLSIRHGSNMDARKPGGGDLPRELSGLVLSECHIGVAEGPTILPAL